MNSIAQISGTNQAAGLSKSTARNDAFAAATGDREFTILLDMLASLTIGSETPQPAADAAAENQAGEAGNSQNQNASGSGTSPSENLYLASIEQQLSEILSSGSDSVKQQGKTNKNSSQTTTSYLIPGISAVVPYQNQNSAAASTQTSSDTTEGTASAAINKTLLSQIERDILAFLESGQSSSSGSGNSSAMADIAQQSKSSDGGAPDISSPLLQEAANPAFKADLLKLLSVASGNASDPKVLKELSALLVNLKNGNNLSAADVAQNQKSSVDTLTNSALPTQTENPTGTTNLSNTTNVTSSTNLSTTINPSGTTNPTGVSNPPGMIAVTGPSNSVQPQTQQQSPNLGGAIVTEVKTNAQNQVSGGTQSGTSASTSSGVSSAGSTASASHAADAGLPQGGGSSNAGTGVANQQSTNSTSQISQIQFSTSNPDSQGSSTSGSSGRDLANMMKAAAGQSFINASGGAKGNISFQQTLSTLSQNPPHTFQQPDISQLTQGIIKEVGMMTQQGKTVVNMKLEPESLGSVTLQVSSEGGKISAQFNVKTADARAYLESSVPQIKQMLETNGVTVSHLNVSLSGGELPSGNARYNYQRRRQGARYYSSQTAKATTVAAAMPEISRTFGYNTMEIQL